MPIAYEIEGITYCSLREVAQAFSRSYGTLNRRLHSGIPIYDAVYGDRWEWDCIRYKGHIYGGVEELSLDTGVDSDVIETRLKRGWLVWDAVNKPTYIIDGKQYSFLHEIAKAYGLNYNTMYNRMFKGRLSLYDAVYYGKPVAYGEAQYPDRRSLCERLNIEIDTLDCLLISKGMKLPDAVSQLLAIKSHTELFRVREIQKYIRRMQSAILEQIERYRLVKQIAEQFHHHHQVIKATQKIQIQHMVDILQGRVRKVEVTRQQEKQELDMRLREKLSFVHSYQAIRFRRYNRSGAERANFVYDVVNDRVNRGWSVLKACTVLFPGRQE